MHTYINYTGAKTTIKDWPVVVRGVKSLSESHKNEPAASVKALLEGNTGQAPICTADAATPTFDSSIFLSLGAFLWFACFVQLNRHGSAPCK